MSETIYLPTSSSTANAHGPRRRPVRRRVVGGIDFGYRNPCAALWGGLDKNGVLWITNEHYVREQLNDYHAARLPHDITWYGDPSGAHDIAEFRRYGMTIHKGDNAVRAGNVRRWWRNAPVAAGQRHLASLRCL